MFSLLFNLKKYICINRKYVKKIIKLIFPIHVFRVAEDPWLRSEIGTSGHYLERPANLNRSQRKDKTAYRSKRSSSADNDITSEKDSGTFRPCKSLITLNKNSQTIING